MSTTKVIIAGGRDFSDYDLLKQTVRNLYDTREGDFEIVSGTARGADQLGERFAKRAGFAVKSFPADWNKYGKSAGYRRNAEMADYADVLVAFWDQKSRGTMHMIDLAKSKGLEVHVVHY